MQPDLLFYGEALDFKPALWGTPAPSTPDLEGSARYHALRSLSQFFSKINSKFIRPHLTCSSSKACCSAAPSQAPHVTRISPAPKIASSHAPHESHSPPPPTHCNELEAAAAHRQHIKRSALACHLQPCASSHTSHVTRQTSHVARHTSALACHLQPCASLDTSHVTRPTSQTRHTSHVTRHTPTCTSNVTRSQWSVTHHTAPTRSTNITSHV